MEENAYKNYLEDLFDGWEPSPREMTRYKRAMEAWENWRVFKAMPKAGGTEDQPHIWLVGVKLIEGVHIAHERARQAREQQEQ